MVDSWGLFDASGAELQETAGRVEGNGEEVTSENHLPRIFTDTHGSNQPILPSIRIPFS
jgi:hypothetical protein